MNADPPTHPDPHGSFCQRVVKWGRPQGKRARAGHLAPLTLIAALAGTFAPATASSVGGISGGHLMIDAVTVSASDKNYDHWADLLAVDGGLLLGPEAPSAGNGFSALPARTVSDIRLTRQLDKASPKLMEACCRGLLLPAVQVDFTRPDGGPTYASIKLSRVYVTSYSVGSGGGDGVPTEEVSLSYTKLALESHGYDAEGNPLGTMRTTCDAVTGEVLLEVIAPGTTRPLALSPLTTVASRNSEPVDVPVTLSGGDVPIELVSLSLTSSNPALFPEGSLTVSGTGHSRFLHLAPAPGVAGHARVQVKATGGGYRVDSFFDVFVELEVGEVQADGSTVPEHSAAGTQVGALFLWPQVPDPVTFELVDSAGGRFRLEGDLLVVNDPGLLDFETSPRPKVVVRARDQSGNIRGMSQLTVAVQNVIEGAFDAWRQEEFTAAQLLDPSISGPGADPNEDSFDNLAAFALGLRAVEPNPRDAYPRLDKIEEGGQTFLTVSFRRRTGDSRLVIAPQLWLGSENGEWRQGGSNFILIGLTPVPPDLEDVTLRTAIPIGDVPRQFVRFQVTR